MSRMRTAFRHGAAVLAAALLVWGAPGSGLESRARQQRPPVSFNREILPILSNNCFTCHGPDEAQRETKFHFDTEEGAFAEPGIIERGNAAKSVLVRRITSTDPDEQMPPPDSGHALTADQIALLTRWIDEGATWDRHWAFTPPSQPVVPEPSNRDWARNPIDRFVLARLEREGLEPSPEADKATLLRRVTLDLTGLPPTPSEIEQFLDDRSPDAYEKRVDALLLSPHYGERMAMPWLDTARYADTHGYHIDSLRVMWPWRDWVIDAFNRNLPFDRFVVEQLAGDLLPGATRDQRVASGFNRNHMINFEGGAIAEEYQVEYVVDRVETTSTAFMGLTMGCARCHTHKYDPITHKDFYRFYAFFNNVPEEGLDGRNGNAVPFLPLPTHDQQLQSDLLDAAIAARDEALADDVVAPLQEAWERQVLADTAPVAREGLTAHYELDGSFSDISGAYRHGRMVAGDPVFEPGRIGRAVAFDGTTDVSFGPAGGFEVGEPFSLAVWLKGRGNLPMAVFDRRAPSGRGYVWHFEDLAIVGIQKYAGVLVLTLTGDDPAKSIRIRTRDRLTFGDWYHVALTYDGSGKAAGLQLYVDGTRQRPDVLADALEGPIASDAELRVAAPFRGQIDDLRLYGRTLGPAEIAKLAVDYPARTIVSGLTGRRSKDEAGAVREYFLTHHAPEPLRRAHAELRVLQRERVALDRRIPNAMVMEELPSPRDTFVLARGDYRNRTEKVTPGVPSILPPLPAGAPANRLGLAQWLVDPAHPLTARVAVNRYWQTYFGTGLVKTQEDFGVQGEPPSHPELLDWLATEFVRTGWDVRAMQRLIVTSSTYRQSSRVTPELLEKDPENRLLARAPRLRLPAELIRDAALAVGGLLDRTVGGPSVFPYQPAGLWEEMAFGEGFSAQTYRQSSGRDLYRRGLYTFWKRTVPPASLAAFDAPDREKCTARRAQTNTPLQALVLMNDPVYVEAARALAQRTLVEAGTGDNTRLTYAFRLATGRDPGRSERGVLRQLLRSRLAAYGRDPASAKRLLAVGDSPANRRLNAAELAAWTTVASAILNLDETITRQ